MSSSKIGVYYINATRWARGLKECRYERFNWESKGVKTLDFPLRHAFKFEIFLVWLILVTFGYEFHLAQLFPFPASARTSKSAHSFASYRPANQTHL